MYFAPALCMLWENTSYYLSCLLHIYHTRITLIAQHISISCHITLCRISFISHHITYKSGKLHIYITSISHDTHMGLHHLISPSKITPYHVYHTHYKNVCYVTEEHYISRHITSYHIHITPCHISHLYHAISHLHRSKPYLYNMQVARQRHCINFASRHTSATHHSRKRWVIFYFCFRKIVKQVLNPTICIPMITARL